MGSFGNLTAFLVSHSHCDPSFVALALGLIGFEGHHQRNIKINVFSMGKYFLVLLRTKMKERGWEHTFWQGN